MSEFNPHSAPLNQPHVPPLEAFKSMLSLVESRLEVIVSASPGMYYTPSYLEYLSEEVSAVVRSYISISQGYRMINSYLGIREIIEGQRGIVVIFPKCISVTLRKDDDPAILDSYFQGLKTSASVYKNSQTLVIPPLEEVRPFYRGRAFFEFLQRNRFCFPCGFYVRAFKSNNAIEFAFMNECGELLTLTQRNNLHYLARLSRIIDEEI